MYVFTTGDATASRIEKKGLVARLRNGHTSTTGEFDRQ